MTLSEAAIRLRLIELNAELDARREIADDRKFTTIVRVFHRLEAAVVEEKILALNRALADTEAAR
jgi:hypothetical protein